MRKHNSSQKTLIKEKESSTKQIQFCTIDPFGEDFIIDEAPEKSIPYKCKDRGYEEEVLERLIDEIIGDKDLISNHAMKPKK